MATLIDELRAKLRPGYSFVSAKGGGFHVENPQGFVLRTHKGGPVRVMVHADAHYKRRVIRQLEEAGCLLREQRSHSPKEPNSSAPKATTVKTPQTLAEEIMRDRNSTPRERSVARAFLELDSKYSGMRALAKELGERLSALDKYER